MEPPTSYDPTFSNQSRSNARKMAYRVVVLVVIVAFAPVVPNVAGEPWRACGYTGNYEPKSRYLTNLKSISAALPGNASASPDLFATAADVGAIPEQVSALALCRGDSDPASCRSCLSQAFRTLPDACPGSKDATIFYDKCTLHYSNIHFLTDDGSWPNQHLLEANSIKVRSEPDRFQLVVAALLNATADYAAATRRRYAAGEADFNQEYPKVYSLAQCTPDLTPARCRSCLADITAATLSWYGSRIGARTLAVRCTFRYESAPFISGPLMVSLGGTPGAPAPAPAAVVPRTPAATRGPKYSVPVMVPVVLLPILAAITLVACLCLWRRSRPVTKGKQTYESYPTGGEEGMESVDSMLMDISALRSATGDFAESNKLGEGGFGAVYKGTLPDGSDIAVKRLSKSSTQGVEQLKNEIALVAKLKHKNLVSLVGVCLEQQERLLVYEFAPNRSLDLVLFDTVKREQLDWEKRYKIVNGIARGLQYLHEDSHLKVVHRDLKANNILLDANMNPKISDFGLARIFDRDQIQGVTNHVVGTYGYMAPEYLMRGNYSVKSDVFSFGVMVLEILTGRRNRRSSNCQQSEDLLAMVWEHWNAGRVSETIDPVMNGVFSEGDARRCVQIALLCVQDNPVDRPVMSSVVMMLGRDTVSLQVPSKPEFFGRNNGGAKPGIASDVLGINLT
ncbi:unnamed protein product [Urochloa decumbens]|uniref:Cysteine-rich receptor-like protein kinase 10 n=1 Tax=Urochloa decumbens TaxID=240449 RepID=A0ABC9DRS5_9POAL